MSAFAARRAPCVSLTFTSRSSHALTPRLARQAPGRSLTPTIVVPGASGETTGRVIGPKPIEIDTVVT